MKNTSDSNSAAFALRMSPFLVVGILLLALPLFFNISILTLLPLIVIAAVQWFYAYILKKPVPLWLKLLVIGAACAAGFVSVSADYSQWMIVGFILAFSLKLFELNSLRDIYFMLIAALMLVGVVLLNFTNMWSALYLFLAAIVLLVLFRYQYLQQLQQVVRELQEAGISQEGKSSDTNMASTEPISSSVSQIAKRVSFWVIASVPLTLLLFYVIPRIDPIGFLPQIKKQTSIGLSDHLSLDNISSLQKTGKVAFRVEFETGVPVTVDNLYWRVLTLEQFNGYRWDDVVINLPFEQEKRNFLNWKSQTAAQPNIIYEVMMEPDERPWLPSLQTPQLLSNNTQLQKDWSIERQDKRDENRFRYKMAQYEDFNPYGFISREQLRPYLYFPENQNPRLVEYGLKLFQQHSDPQERVLLIKRFLQVQDIEYSLSPAPLPQDSNLDAFIYDTRQGYCEHFASATAFLMRAADIPSRIVTGFAGGEWNSVGEYLIVRQDEAHAWVEYWLEGEGWVMFDPTTLASSIATPRPLEQFSDMQQQLAADNNGYRSVFTSASWFLNLDALNYQWYRWVVNYDVDTQSEFWQQMKQWRWQTIFSYSALLLIGVFLTWWLYRKWKNRPQDKLLHEWRMFEQFFARNQLARKIGETPEAFSMRVAEQFSNNATDILQFKDAWMLQMYGDAANMSLSKLRALQALRKRACKHS